VSAGHVLAHGIGGRSDLPVPLWLAQYGAVAALVVSFAVLGMFWRTPRLEGAAGDGRPLPDALQRFADARATRVGLRALGLLMFVVTVLVATLGPNNSGANPAPTWVYVWFWVGLVPASLLLGPVWRLLNPLRTVSAGLAWLAGDPHHERARPMPPRLGYWPAAVALVTFAWFELVYPYRDEPYAVLVFLVLYVWVQLVAAFRYGPAWYARGDGFEVYSTLVASLCPIGRRTDGRLGLRNPLAGLAALRPAPGLLAVICALLGSTAFDGLSRTRWWTDLTLDTGPVESTVLGTAGLLGAIGVVAVTYTAAIRAAERYRRVRPAAAGGVGNPEVPLSWQFAHSLVPILIGYTIAHYFSLLVFQGQAGYILASDPLQKGWDLFGTADWKMNLVLVSTSAIALIQVGAIVTGHVLGVVTAHDRAVATFRGRDMLRGQYLLLTTMVFYTLSGIALLVGT
jgi:tryptophan-rich sensory protein